MRAGPEAGGWAGEEKASRRRGWGCVPPPTPRHLLEGPGLGYSLGTEVQQRLGPAPAAHGPGPGIALLGSRGAAPAPFGRGGVHRPGRGRGGACWGVSPMPALRRRLPRPLPAFQLVFGARPPRDPSRTHPRPAPGRPGDAAPLRLFTTMKLPQSPLYPPPSSRPRRPSPLAPPSASVALLRYWLRRQTCPQVLAAHSLDVLLVLSRKPNQNAHRAVLSIMGRRRPIIVGGPPADPALCGVSGRTLGSFTTFLSRPPLAGQRAPGSWGCAHTRLCLLRVASGLRKGTINTTRPGSETERRDSKPASQPLLPLGCARQETLSASLGAESSFDICGIGVGGWRGSQAPRFSSWGPQTCSLEIEPNPCPKLRTLNPFCALNITLSHMKWLIFDLLRRQFQKVQLILVTSDRPGHPLLPEAARGLDRQPRPAAHAILPLPLSLENPTFPLSHTFLRGRYISLPSSALA